MPLHWFSGSSDPGWEHGIPQDERKKKVKCNYCEKVVSGGIYRLKQHLARISGEVTYCANAPEDVYAKMKENLEGQLSAKRQRQSEDEEQPSFDHISNEEEEEPARYKRKGKQANDDKKRVAEAAPLRSLGFVDPGWEHGVSQDERKKKVKCNYCGKVVSGGINRFKQHLAKIPGEVAYCKLAPEEVYLKMKENMKWHRTGRRQHSHTKDLDSFYMNTQNESVDEKISNGNIKEKHMINDKTLVPWTKTTRKRSRIISSCSGSSGRELQSKQSELDFVSFSLQKSPLPAAYMEVKKTDNDKSAYKEVASAICKFFCHVGLPFGAVDSPYFHRLLDLASRYGQGIRNPSSQLISSQYLQDEVVAIKESLIEFKTSWMVTGCTVIADSWKDVRGRTLINFLVSCPRGMHFISSIDASEIVEDATKLFTLLDKVVEEVGEDNVVQIVTENTTNYKSAGKMLEEKRKHLFWTPCAAYCIDRMLEDFTNIKLVRECLSKGQKITKFIYNRAWLLNLMKKEFTNGQELLRAAVTRCASSFTTVHNLINNRLALRRMFQSEKWVSSKYAKVGEGKVVEKIVFSSRFWKKMHYVNKSVDPLLQVLLKVDGEKGLPISSIYNDLYRARLTIKEIHGDEVRKYSPFWGVIDGHWHSLFQHPLYMAAYFLNPSYRYRPDFLALPEVIRGLNECIVRLEPDTGRRISASMQISDFISAKADFGTELAISTRSDLDPAAWWQQHGIDCLELQRIAIRILSQSSSCYGCEHYWSGFDQIHSTRHNSLAQKRFNDITYVHYNLRLKERQLRRRADDSLTLDGIFEESLLGEWIIETENSVLLDEETLYNKMDNAETNGNDVNGNEDLDAEARKVNPEATTFSGIVQSLEGIPARTGTATDDDDAGFDFLDGDLSD